MSYGFDDGQNRDVNLYYVGGKRAIVTYIFFFLLWCIFLMQIGAFLTKIRFGSRRCILCPTRRTGTSRGGNGAGIEVWIYIHHGAKTEPGAFTYRKLHINGYRVLSAFNPRQAYFSTIDVSRNAVWIQAGDKLRNYVVAVWVVHGHSSFSINFGAFVNQKCALLLTWKSRMQ